MCPRDLNSSTMVLSAAISLSFDQECQSVSSAALAAGTWAKASASDVPSMCVDFIFLSSWMAVAGCADRSFGSLPVFSSLEYQPLIAPAVMPWTKKRPSAK